MPRWSVAGRLLPVSTAGLAAASACVSVGPPLSASAPSSAIHALLLARAREQACRVIDDVECDVTALGDTGALRASTGVAGDDRVAQTCDGVRAEVAGTAAAGRARLPAIVTLRSVSVFAAQRDAAALRPPRPAVLPLIVELHDA